MATRYLIEIRLVGENMLPDKISSRDVGGLITSVEQMIASIVARNNPALGLSDDEVIVGLAHIEQGSYILQFQTIYEAEVATAYAAISRSISSENYETLPIKSIDALKTVRKLTRKYRTDIQFWENNGHYVQLATVSLNTKIDAEIPTITGKTTLYGKVIGIGGEEPPRARLRLLNGVKFNCHITRRHELRIARELGQKLYSVVGVKGMARWDSRDMSLQYFLIEQLTPYVPKPVSQALDSLSQAAGKYYEDVSDIDMLVADMRGNDEEM
jgi:hypothetical protein